MQLTTTAFRAIRVPTARQVRASLTAVGCGALIFFLFEASKSAVFPRLTIWQSHSITIAFGAIIAGAAAWVTMDRQATYLRTLAAGEAARERLEMRERTLQESEARFRQLVEQSPEAIAVHREGHLIYVNAAGATLIGARDASELMGRRAIDFVHPDDLHLVRRRALAAPAHWPYRLRRLDGEAREVEAVSVAITYQNAPAVQTVFRDVTERRKLEAQLRHEAFHDGLTELANRALFRDRLKHALAFVPRQPAQRLAVLFLDLDDFKAVNDGLGHEAGDRLLVAVADRLRVETRDADTVARFGGDEFAILLEHLTSDTEALAIVHRIRGALGRPFLLEGRSVTVAASIGVAFNGPGDDVDSLLRNADVAMYEAKEGGKARHAVFEMAMYDAIVHRMQLEHDLRLAADDPDGAGLFLVYQPIVELETGRVRSLEALLRWQHPRRGPIPVSAFITVAEETGAIVPLGRWILETACRQLVAWRTQWRREQRDPATLPTISVNISGRQLSEATFVPLVEEILHRTQAPANGLTLEITESVIMRNTEDSLRTLSALKRIGVTLAIDDFGTGYSSLSYLQRFPVDVLKIDRAFVEGVGAGGSDSALARTIVTLGNTLGLRTIAEGIEHESQRSALQRMGCQDGQGYLFSVPRPAADMSAWLLQYTGSVARIA